MIDPLTAKSMLLTVSTVGITANASALVTVFYCKYLHNMFGALCGALAIVNSLELSIIVVWCALGGDIFDESSFTGLFGRAVGIVILILMYSTSYLHLVVSLNRFIFVTFPLRYISSSSGPGKTILAIMIAIFLAVLQMSPLLLMDDCVLVYDVKQFLWIFSETASCEFFQNYVDFGSLVFMCCSILIIDAVTFVNLNKILYSSAIKTSKHKKQNERMFFIQSVCQISSYLICYFFYCILSRYATTEWTLFLYTTFSWNIMHAMEGVIMVIFHARLIYTRRPTVVKNLASSTRHSA